MMHIEKIVLKRFCSRGMQYFDRGMKFIAFTYNIEIFWYKEGAFKAHIKTEYKTQTHLEINMNNSR